jgi:hypothetical protein
VRVRIEQFDPGYDTFMEALESFKYLKFSSLSTKVDHCDFGKVRDQT